LDESDRGESVALWAVVSEGDTDCGLSPPKISFA
jgi:hypothetical protein